jgi:hypothetical protein
MSFSFACNYSHLYRADNPVILYQRLAFRQVSVLVHMISDTWPPFCVDKLLVVPETLEGSGNSVPGEV